MKTVEERLQHYSLQMGGHLIWCGTLNPGGYGRIWFNGSESYTHRLAWELTYGSVPRGVYVLHLCDTPPCIEPTHLYLGTQVENIQDAVRAGNHRSASTNKTRCKWGHPFDDENTYIDPRGWRSCRACAREAARYSRAHPRAR